MIYIIHVGFDPSSKILARTTIDIDLLGNINNRIKNLENIVCECCAIEIDDGVIFDKRSVKGESIRKNAEYQGVRILPKVFLRKIRSSYTNLFAFGDEVVTASIEIDLPQIPDSDSPHHFG